MGNKGRKSSAKVLKTCVSMTGALRSRALTLCLTHSPSLSFLPLHRLCTLRRRQRWPHTHTHAHTYTHTYIRHTHARTRATASKGPCVDHIVLSVMNTQCAAISARSSVFALSAAGRSSGRHNGADRRRLLACKKPRFNRKAVKAERHASPPPGFLSSPSSRFLSSRRTERTRALYKGRHC